MENKVAIDAELSDFLKNERFEDTFVVEGTPRIPDDVVGKPWQDRAVRDVRKVIKILMGKELRIVFVQNATTRQADAIVTYNVKMSSVSDSKAIRDKFGSFFLGGRGDQRPPALKPYSIKNRVTPETKIRISLLKLLAQRYRDSNPGSRVQVIGYDPRPLIKITPAADASDRRVKIYNYVEAVKALPIPSASELAPIIRRINPRLSGQIRSVFIILSDDQYKIRTPDASTSSRGISRGASRGTTRGTSRGTTRGANRGTGRGGTSTSTSTRAQSTVSDQVEETPTDQSESEEAMEENEESEEVVDQGTSGRGSRKRNASGDNSAPPKR